MKVATLILILLGLVTPISITSCSSFYGSLVKNEAKSIEELNQILATVNNKESADAAAPLITKHGQALSEVIGQAFSNGKPSLLELWRMKNQLEADSTKSAAQNLLSEYVRLSISGFYGSTALKDAFYNQFMSLKKNIPSQ